MAKVISIRLDHEALVALRRLEATGLSRSEAICRSLIETASRLSDRKTLASEVALLEADEDDRAEVLTVAELMGSLRASG